MNLACWYFCKFSSSILRYFVLVIEVLFLLNGFFTLVPIEHSSHKLPGTWVGRRCITVIVKINLTVVYSQTLLLPSLSQKLPLIPGLFKSTVHIINFSSIKLSQLKEVILSPFTLLCHYQIYYRIKYIRAQNNPHYRKLGVILKTSKD